MRGRRLTTRAMARPKRTLTYDNRKTKEFYGTVPYQTAISLFDALASASSVHIAYVGMLFLLWVPPDS